MDTVLTLAWALSPIVFAGAVSLFVINGLKRRMAVSAAERERRGGWQAADSAIPLSMLAGGGIAAAFSLFTPILIVYAIPIGAAAGMLIGYFIFLYVDKEQYTSS